MCIIEMIEWGGKWQHGEVTVGHFNTFIIKPNYFIYEGSGINLWVLCHVDSYANYETRDPSSYPS